MNPRLRARKPFQFCTASYLLEITPRKAFSLEELREGVRAADDATIYCHTHQALREYHFASALYQNEFAYWAGEMLGDSILAEKLASLDIREFTSIDAIRQHIVAVIDQHLAETGGGKHVAPGREFYFTRSVAVITPLPVVVWTLAEFCEALRRVGIQSLSTHFFDARLRLGKRTNDFSLWIEEDLGLSGLADQIEALDPYLNSLDEIREKIIALVRGTPEARPNGFWPALPRILRWPWARKARR